MLDLTRPKQLYGLAQRAVGVESLRFVAEVLRTVRPRIESCLPAWESSALGQQFFGSTVTMGVPDLCSFVYESAAAAFVNLEGLADRISNLNWEMRDVTTQANNYVKQLAEQYKVLGSQLDQLDLSTVPTAARLDIWRSAVAVGMDAIVEGYSRIRKCSTEGRASMALDLKFLQQEIEKLTTLRPLPKLETVDLYIKGFYIPETDIWDWIVRYQGDFSIRQIKALVEVTLWH